MAKRQKKNWYDGMSDQEAMSHSNNAWLASMDAKERIDADFMDVSGEEWEEQHHRDNIKFARKGYHGIVNKRTRFIAGEAGPERVDITPIKKKHAFDYF